MRNGQVLPKGETSSDESTKKGDYGTSVDPPCFDQYYDNQDNEGEEGRKQTDSEEVDLSLRDGLATGHQLKQHSLDEASVVGGPPINEHDNRSELTGPDSTPAERHADSINAGVPALNGDHSTDQWLHTEETEFNSAQECHGDNGTVRQKPAVDIEKLVGDFEKTADNTSKSDSDVGCSSDQHQTEADLDEQQQISDDLRNSQPISINVGLNVSLSVEEHSDDSYSDMIAVSRHKSDKTGKTENGDQVPVANDASEINSGPEKMLNSIDSSNMEHSPADDAVIQCPADDVTTDFVDFVEIKDLEFAKQQQLNNRQMTSGIDATDSPETHWSTAVTDYKAGNSVDGKLRPRENEDVSEKVTLNTVENYVQSEDGYDAVDFPTFANTSELNSSLGSFAKYTEQPQLVTAAETAMWMEDKLESLTVTVSNTLIANGSVNLMLQTSQDDDHPVDSDTETSQMEQIEMELALTQSQTTGVGRPLDDVLESSSYPKHGECEPYNGRPQFDDDKPLNDVLERSSSEIQDVWMMSIEPESGNSEHFPENTCKIHQHRDGAITDLMSDDDYIAAAANGYPMQNHQLLNLEMSSAEHHEDGFPKQNESGLDLSASATTEMEVLRAADIEKLRDAIMESPEARTWHHEASFTSNRDIHHLSANQSAPRIDYAVDYLDGDDLWETEKHQILRSVNLFPVECDEQSGRSAFKPILASAPEIQVKQESAISMNHGRVKVSKDWSLWAENISLWHRLAAERRSYRDQLAIEQSVKRRQAQSLRQLELEASYLQRKISRLERNLCA